MTSDLVVVTPTLLECEQRILDSQRTFVAALYDIYRQELWREAGDATFDAYLDRRWGYKERYRRYLRSGMKVMHALHSTGAVEIQLVRGSLALPGGTEVPESSIDNAALPAASPRVETVTRQPVTESELRTLAQLATDDQRAAAWQTAVALAGGEHPTPAQVETAVKRLQNDQLAEADQRLLDEYARTYPYVVAAVQAKRLKLSDAAALVNLLNGVNRAVREMAVNAALVDQAVIRELTRIAGTDSFEELQATGILQFEDESYVPLRDARYRQLRDWLDERKRAHQRISYDAATATYTCTMTVNSIDDETGVYAMVTLPKAVLARLKPEASYDIQIRVVERTKEVN